MTTFTIDKIRLEKLLDKIVAGGIQLPEFQRGWIWDDDHIKNLLASVSRNYPIGTIMMLETGNKELNFAARPITGVKTENKDPDELILDGQQRLTALFQSLYSDLPANPKESMSTKSRKRINRWYYMDIKKALAPGEENIEEAINGSADKLGFDQQYNELLFPLFKTFDFSNWRDECDSYWHHDDEIRRLLRQFESSIIHECFYSYDIPYVTLLKETQPEAICPIFERINSTGVNLDVFDLLVAIYASKNFNLRKDWETRERRLTEKNSVLNDIKGSDFVKTVTLLATYNNGNNSSNVSCSRKTILKLELKNYKEWAEAATTGYEKTVKFLASQKIFDSKYLPYTTQLIPLSAIFAVLGGKSENAGVRDKLVRWYWCGVLGELYRGIPESRFVRDLKEVLNWIKDDRLEPTTIIESNFSAKRILDLKDRRSAAFKGIYSLLLQNGAKDFLSDITIDIENYFNTNIDIHHIFPKKWCERNVDSYDDRCDCIVNKTPLSNKTHTKIGDRSTEEYLRILEKEGKIKPSRMDDILKSHLIKPSALRSNNFEEFFSEREKNLLKIIESATGKQILD
ncbi:MAG: DUF262 domain-containing protein [Methanothrix sp.]|nr:DUF262 domain-containing protein [Methanothrix sp.]